jgi:hypothetical protein
VDRMRVATINIPNPYPSDHVGVAAHVVIG